MLNQPISMKVLIRIVPIFLVLLIAGCTTAINQTTSDDQLMEVQIDFVQGEGNADVVFVRAEYIQDGSWTFTVTVSHPDTGWEDYADGWDVLLSDGTVLKPDAASPFTRLLLHPHVGEQPFTRSQSGILIPEGERFVSVRAHDLVDGYGGQAVVVDLSSGSGDLYEVIRPVSGQTGGLGLTNHNLDGNRYLTGVIDLHTAAIVDIPLNGVPAWVVGVPQGAQQALWLVAMQDGTIQVFQVSASGSMEIALPLEQLAGGAPPAVRSTEDGLELLNSLAPDGAKMTHPVPLPNGSLAFITVEGSLALEENGQLTTLDLAPLPDGRILVDEEGTLLLLSEPSALYGHGVLGDAVEARSLSLVSANAGGFEVFTFAVPAGQVIEGLVPMWVDLDGDGQREILVTLSDGRDGARLVVYSQAGEMIARSRAIGTGYRWRHQIAAAPFGPNGEIEVVDVLTPHLGGVVEFFQMQGEDLVVVAQVSGYTSHVIGSRNLDMALAADVNGDGQVELLLPNQRLDSLAAIQRTEDGAEVIWEASLPGMLTTNLGGVRFPDGTISIAAGLSEGVLQVWLP